MIIFEDENRKLIKQGPVILIVTQGYIQHFQIKSFFVLGTVQEVSLLLHSGPGMG